MIDYSVYSCDKCAREFSRYCKRCLHTADKPPTKFKHKKKIGTQVPQQHTVPHMPLHSGYTPIASAMPKPPKTGSKVNKHCQYKTPCGWCTKWDKKCDMLNSKGVIQMEPNKCCNQTPSVVVVTDYMSDNILGYYVACDNCGHQSRLTLTKDDAIAVWNEKEENQL